jgi:hypothetical protein
LPLASPNFSPRRLNSTPFKNPMTFPQDGDIIESQRRGSRTPETEGTRKHIFTKKTMNG